jgi:prepilin-type N-terminal cleavage/methylation domain-containing protein/prepilin-type processing-associated H-X9-DG protein
MKRRKAFTLIELLVVIAIIALLLAILVPSLKKAKELANGIVCGAKVKNIATASYTYSSTGDGYFVPAGYLVPRPGRPPYTWPITDDDYTAGARYWYENETFRSYLKINDYSVKSNSVSVSALRLALSAMPKEFLCPSDKISKKRPASQTRISYAYNNSDWRPWTQNCKIIAYKVETVKHPAETLNFVDSITHDVDFNGGHYKGIWDRIKNLPPDPATWPDVRTTYGSAHYRHNEGANVGFYDGHAQCLKKEIIFDIDGYYATPTRTGMWTASGRMIPGWFMRFPDFHP